MLKEQKIREFYFSCFRECLELVYGFDSSLFNTQIVKVKTSDNIQYNFDVELDRIIKSKLKEYGITGRIFSEESGFFNNGEMLYRVVYDPFCNSTLFSRGILDAACGVSIFTTNYQFISAAILDYQTGIVALATDNKTEFFRLQDREKWLPFDIKPQGQKDTWLVAKLENKKERAGIEKITDLVKFPERLIIGSGHIYWLRLAMGTINGYTVFIQGEKIYEMLASVVAEQSGCIITDLQDNKFEASEWLKKFEENPNLRYKFVAARDKKLHKKLFQSVEKYK